MPRLMSVSFTADAVVARTKTVTRRVGWLHAEPGMPLTLCRKVMGRRKGEPLVRLAEVEIVDVRREPLFFGARPGEMTLEGFPAWESREGFIEFVVRFFAPQGVGVGDPVTRIEWRYLDG